MDRSSPGSWWTLAAWLAFPIVPAVLARTYQGTVHPGGSDPRDWDLTDWLILTGPLWGFGFLAGATVGLPDDPSWRGVRGRLASRAIWVAIGPWAGYILGAGVVHLLNGLGVPIGLPAGWLGMVVLFGLLGVLAYGWLVVALAISRRARRLGRLGPAIRRGLVSALAFVGSLFGSFWAATEAWRAYFFDPTVLKMAALAMIGLSVIGGCSGPITAGEARRRELFEAMLTAWVIGLALAWRWWARPRPPRG